MSKGKAQMSIRLRDCLRCRVKSFGKKENQCGTSLDIPITLAAPAKADYFEKADTGDAIG